MEAFKSKYIIIYADGRIWQSNDESLAIAKLDSDKYIIAAFTRDNGFYTLRSDGDGVNYES